MYAGQFNGQGMITLSFDDGREDNFRVALPIMEKYGLVGTVHVTTGWVDGTWTPNPLTWLSAVGGAMTLSQLKKMDAYGIELSSHGDQHTNTEADMKTCVNKLRSWGFDRVEGHASPGSNLTVANVAEKKLWFQSAGLTHSRSSIAPDAPSERDKRNNINYPPQYDYRLTSQVVVNSTTIATLSPLIYDAIDNKRWCILMLHSILLATDAGYGGDLYYWDVSKFEDLCKMLSKIPKHDLLIVTMRDGIQYANNWQKESVTNNRGHGLSYENQRLVRHN